MQVDAVRDDAIVRCLRRCDTARQARVAVVEWGHGVESVGQGRGAGGEGGGAGAIRGGAVAEGDDDVPVRFGQVGDEGNGAGEFGGEGDEFDGRGQARGAVGGFGRGGRGGEEEVGVVGTAFGRGEEGAFDVGAE